MPYDQYGRGVDYPKKTKRHRELNLTPWQTVVAGIILVTVTIVVAWSMTRKPNSGNQAVKTGPRHDSMCVSYTYNGEAIRWYVVTDPDTQRQYLFNDRGGVCLREPYEERDESMRVIRHDDGTVEYVDTTTDSKKQQVTVE